ncbi:MAG: hypothetical protein R2783_02910 [Gelidibacter sp.]
MAVKFKYTATGTSRHGHYYEEIYSKDPKESIKKPAAKSYFETYTLNVDLNPSTMLIWKKKSFSDQIQYAQCKWLRIIPLIVFKKTNAKI